MKVLIFNAHPRAGSLIDSLTETYHAEMLRDKLNVVTIQLRNVLFNPLADPENRLLDEPALLKIREEIQESHHVTFLFPTWWTGTPALLKGFIDRTFIRGWAFKFKNRFPVGLLNGKSARIIYTMGAPRFYNEWFQGAPQRRMLQDGLKTCGFTPVRVTAIGSIKKETKASDKIFHRVTRAAQEDMKGLMKILNELP